MIKTVVIPTDGSNHSRKGVMLGAELASKFDARVVLVHVLLRNAPIERVHELVEEQKLPKKIIEMLEAAETIPPVSMPVFSGPITPFVPFEVLVELGQHLLEVGKHVVEGHNVKDVKLVMEDGDPADKVIEVAKRENADFIVMGHRGLGALQELFAGSVSTKVGHLAECTVVSVK